MDGGVGFVRVRGPRVRELERARMRANQKERPGNSH